jgi:hypothetical protein
MGLNHENIPSSKLPPEKPFIGMLWHNPENNFLWEWTGAVWVKVTSVFAEGDMSEDFVPAAGVKDVGPDVPHETSQKCAPEEASEKLAMFFGNLEIPKLPVGRLDFEEESPEEAKKTAENSKKELIEQYKKEIKDLHLELFYTNPGFNPSETTAKTTRVKYLEDKVKQLESTPVEAILALRRAVLKNFKILADKLR